ncbi:MAG TPA: 16S rRNA (guanine(527)-N(7))-methyltransferase RsmG [Candidatus Tenderia sp.]|nr:16S rRNA (guanine(527)-N(7))-methyltransferase RsmG [Candidatus Tenderia sp.]
MDEKRQLAEGLAQMGLSLDEATQDRLLHFLNLMRKWNRVYNLTSRKDMDNMVARHLLDSLALVPYLNGSRLVDVGSGAGLPAIPLALACPEKQFVSLDCVTKKGRFRTQAMIELGLKNMEVVTSRVEAYQPEVGFDSVVSRAFATISDMLAVSGHLVADDGVFLAMKGVYPEEELADIPAQFRVEVVHELQVPYLSAARHLAVVTPNIP